MRRILLGLALAASLSAPVLAHPKLLGASPAADTTVTTAPRTLVLNFSEKLIAPMSGAELTMIMPGMAGHAIPVKTSVGADGRSLVLVPASPLPRGQYQVDWHVVSADTHRITGSYKIQVG
ncbi:methionine-rich copper-binding protein CopC [Sphingomonas sp. SORGH_AS 950]|uniref:copper homeostasis periplasmic binding protein CopC n=1 Tax=Sphingomonas sp. SORGH_AS_0950 TaxID=3041792 RepID=UPI002785A99B|nr:copper homeostasis periplasmic binding protein CopC [Sphingomonas sp. SORGH_AS_0950]MDQ1155967.1 methionine-rich copper-binding protein CopC [Sphingomonas sp. SORGH_AS_0950]